MAAGVRGDAHRGGVAEVAVAGVEHHEVGAVADGAAQGGAGHGVVGHGAVADHEDGARLLEHRQGAGGVAHAGARPRARERDARRLHGAVVEVVGAEHGAEELLRLVGLLVGAHRRDEAGDAAGRAELLGDQVERLVPARLDQHAVLAHQRLLEAGALVRLQHGEAAALAQAAAVGRHVAGAGDLDHLAVLEVHDGLAAHAAVRAGGAHALQLPVPGHALGGALGERPDGAGVDALAAELALVEVRQRVPVLAAGALGAPAGGMRHHAVDLDGGAGGPAAAAEDALGVVADDVGVLDERELLGGRQLARRLDLVLVGEPAELALAERLAGDAGVAAGADDELERGAAGAPDARRSWSGRPCPRWPACCRPAAAGRRRPPRPRRGGTRRGGPPRAGSRASGWGCRWRSRRRGWSGRARRRGSGRRW